MLRQLINLATPVLLCCSAFTAAAQTPDRPIICPKCNLRGVAFNSKRMGDKRFVNSNLANADLRYADLSNMYMLTTNLRRADLRGANLSHTFFTASSNFENADLRGANLNDVWFTDANLRGADLRGTNVEDITTLEGADLRGAKVDVDFYAKVLADQPYGICLANTTLPNGDVIQNSCQFR